MRRLLRISIWLVVSYLLLCGAIAIFLADATLHPYRRPLPADAALAVREQSLALNSQLREAEIQTQDHVRLRAWLIDPQHGNGNAVILLHGLGDNRLGTIGYAQIFLAHGYSVLMPDARAHGMSEGDVATYGILERNDIRRWFEWLDESVHPVCIYALGESMGAAQLLQALAVEPHFCAIIAESSFATFREIAYDRMGQRFGTGPWVGRTILRPVVEIALLVAKIRYHVDLTKASPEDAVTPTQVPVLLIHGVVDSNIPLRHSLRLTAHNRQFKLWQVAGADHCGAISAAPQEFEQRVVEWFEMHRSDAEPVRLRVTNVAK
jgi:uncharacterized protein